MQGGSATTEEGLAVAGEWTCLVHSRGQRDTAHRHISHVVENGYITVEGMFML
jgi:hypothetical protein